jgi:hypothetical protein
MPLRFNQRTHALSGYALLGDDDHPWHRSLGSRHRILGAITPDAAAASVIQASGVKSGTISSKQMAQIVASIQAMQVQDPGGNYEPGTSSCAASGVSQGANDLKLVGSAGSLALTTASSAQVGLIAAGPATLGISIAIAGIVGIFSTIMAHHAAAVKKEQNVLCSAVPAANNYLQIIAQAVAAGQATPAQGIQALQSLSSNFDSAVSSIRKMGGSSCNAACIMTEELRGVIAYMSSQFQDLISAQAAVGASTVPAAQQTRGIVTTSTGPVVAAPVSSGATMQLPVTATPAQIQAAATAPTPAAAAAAMVQPVGVLPPGATAAPSLSDELQSLESSLPTWWPIAAVGILAFLFFEAA